MALLQIRVNIGSPSLPDTPQNREKIFMYSGYSTSFQNYGNTPAKPRGGTGMAVWDMNNPWMPNAISVSSYARVTFDSHAFNENQSLAEEIVTHIDRGYIIVEDTAAPGVPLNRAAIMAFV
jgi:hypothetical protein